MYLHTRYTYELGTSKFSDGSQELRRLSGTQRRRLIKPFDVLEDVQLMRRQQSLIELV
jgi:hypothetical protein